MNFNVYIDSSLGERLEQCVKIAHKSRNAIIREALEQYLNHASKQEWSQQFINFTGDPNSIVFEAYRNELMDDDSDREFLF